MIVGAYNTSLSTYLGTILRVKHCVGEKVPWGNNNSKSAPIGGGLFIRIQRLTCPRLRLSDSMVQLTTVGRVCIFIPARKLYVLTTIVRGHPIF